MPFDSETGRQAGQQSRRAARDRNTQWQALAESIAGEHAESFNAIMNEWKKPISEGGTLANQQRFADNYQKILKYFKPTLQSTSFDAGEGDIELTLRVKKNGDTD